MAELVAKPVIESILAEYVKRIVDKASKGKRLSDWEVGILMIDYTRSILNERINSVERSLTERISNIEKSLNERIETLEKSLNERISSVEKSLNDRINNVEERLNERISNGDKLIAEKVEGINARLRKVEDDIDYIKRSLDSLRDNVINVLVAELKRRMEKEV
ncbi:MAG: hypothetical protein QXX84_05685 [Sulfolobales archaeon]|nr:hypothetical protein [Sulfolobales archaeon]